MLLRTAFVALIIFMLSRPVLRGFGWLGGAAGRDVTIVLDSGASMNLRTAGTTSFERAQVAARTIVDLLKPDDHVTVIRAGEKADRLVSRSAGYKQAIVEEINNVKVSAGPANVGAALEDVLRSPPRGARVVYVLTDANRRAWAGLAGSPVTTLAGNDDQVVVMNVGPTEPVTNLAVIGEPPRSLHTVVGLPVILSATMVNTSGGTSGGPRDTVLSVFLDDQQITQLNLTLQPGQKTTRSITVTPTRAGVIQGRFQIPPDEFTDDDSYLFCLNVQPKLSVLVLTSPPAPPPADAPDLFIRAALASPLAADTAKIAASLEVTSVVYNAATDPQLAAADAVILTNIPMDPALAARLRKFVNDGGGLIVFPGASTNPDVYQAHLFNAPPGTPGAPPAPTDPKNPPKLLSYLPPVGDPNDETKFQPVTSIDLHHPILSAFAEQGAEYFGTVRLYRYFPIQLPTAPAPGTPRPLVLMRLPDRTPLLVETSIGDGKMLIAGFASMTDWSNLPLKPEFVPVLLRSVAHVRRASDADTVPAVKPGEPAPVRLSARFADAQVEAIDPSGKPTSIALTRAGTGFVGTTADTGRKGFYRFVVTPRAATPPPPPPAPQSTRHDVGFAVNLDVTGADFATMNEAELQETLRPMKLAFVKGSAEDPTLVRQLRQQRELWRTLIWVMFAVMGLEFLLATLKPARRIADARAVAAGRAANPVRRFADRVTAALAPTTNDAD
jgi:hypothetical protein